MGLFDQIGSVKASLDANYVRPGHYAFLIEAGKLAADRVGIPFTVLEMVCVAVYPDTAGYLPIEESGVATVKPHFVGERASHLLKNGGPGKDMFLPNIKSMLMGILAIAEADVTPQLVERCFVPQGGESALRGLVVEVQARNIKTKQKKDFTRITYLGIVPLERYEEIGVQLPAEWRQEGAAQEQQ